jgi:hypothetical protein
MPGHPDFAALQSSTLRNARSAIVDNLTEQNALLKLMRSKGGIRHDSGGTTIDEPLLYGDNDTVKSYAGYEVLNTQPQEGLTTAQYAWKQLAGSVSISGIEEFKNAASKTRVFNLLMAKMRQLKISFSKEVNRQMFADGTGNAGKDIGGLALLVSDAASTVGGIDESAAGNSWWANQRIDFNAVYTTWNTASNSSIEGLDAFRVMWNDVIRNSDKPDLLIGSDTVHEAYEAYTEGDKYRTFRTDVADLGFDNVAFKGVPYVWDVDITDNRVYFLNFDYLKFVIGSGKDFITTDFDRPHAQDAKLAHMLLYANMTVSNRARQGVIFDIVF